MKVQEVNCKVGTGLLRSQPPAEASERVDATYLRYQGERIADWAEGARTLEIGCAGGYLLAAVAPAGGVGPDFSAGMIECARRKYSGLRFILSDMVNDLWDVQQVFRQIRRLSNPGTRLILNFYNRLWELPLNAARRVGAARPNLYQNWFTVEWRDQYPTLEPRLVALAAGVVRRAAHQVHLRRPVKPQT